MPRAGGHACPKFNLLISNRYFGPVSIRKALLTRSGRLAQRARPAQSRSTGGRITPRAASGRDGFLNWKTTLSGEGRVAINVGEVEAVDIDDAEPRQGRLVPGRTAGLGFASRRSARFPRNLISGQRWLHVFGGTGKALVWWTPNCNQRMYQRMTGEDIEGPLLE